MPAKQDDIPQEWIKRYVDMLLAVVVKVPEGPTQDAALLRADHVMDMVKTFREGRNTRRGLTH